MFHGDLHVGNVLVNDKKKFVLVDFERCTMHITFDAAEHLLLCFLEKLYVFRFFFDLTSSTDIKLHKVVHTLFVKYFAEKQQDLTLDNDWATRFRTVLRENISEAESYSDFISAKKVALHNLFHAKLFKLNNKSYMFHQYLFERRFKKLQCF
jgi:hypothetical protein